MKGPVCLLAQATYKPGDLPPEGYLAWHEWAEVQRKAGIKQVPCGRCCRWKTPQELSETIDRGEAMTSRGERVELTSAVCTKCDLDTKKDVPDPLGVAGDEGGRMMTVSSVFQAGLAALLASLLAGCFPGPGSNARDCAIACRPRPLESYTQQNGACLCHDDGGPCRP